MTRSKAVWLTLLAYLELLFGALVGAASLLAIGALVWLVVISVSKPAALLYVPIFVWLASNMGLGMATVGFYRIGILSAYSAGDVERAIRLSKVGPLVFLGATTAIDVGELPTTATVRWINRSDGCVGYLAVACVLIAVALDRL